MTTTPRYAVYYVPNPDSALARFGAEIIGYDISSGIEMPFPSDIVDNVPDWAALTDDARRYGFHATLKAPFALAPGKTESELITACDVFATTPREIPSITPIVQTIGGFAAVIPKARSAPLDLLARNCVEAFDIFRAKMTPQDRARRNPEHLTVRQIRHLDRWGYPYVFEDFRFHMTLTGRITETQKTEVLTLLQVRYAAIDLRELSIDRLALVRQPNSTSCFRVVHQWLLRSS